MLAQNVAALALVGALVASALPHPLVSPKTKRIVEGAVCGVLFGLAFSAGSGGVGATPTVVAVASGGVGVALYLGLLALFISLLSRRWIANERRHPVLRD